jgi:hypothetical protein
LSADEPGIYNIVDLSCLHRMYIKIMEFHTLQYVLPECVLEDNEIITLLAR